MKVASFTLAALAVALALAVFASPFASPSPDGLEKVAEAQGFLADGRANALQERSPAPGYAFPGVDDPRVATALAGLAGTLLVAAAGAGVAVARRRA